MVGRRLPVHRGTRAEVADPRRQCAVLIARSFAIPLRVRLRIEWK